jgi:membrane-associated phospholipid phosphatase
MTDRQPGADAAYGVQAPAHPERTAETWVCLALAVLGLGGFALLAWTAAMQVAIPFDQSLLDLARSWSTFSVEWELLSNAANIPMIFVGVGLVLWLFWKGARREAVLVVVTLAVVTAGSEAVKQLVHRPRPPGSDAVVPGIIYSFPSGHVLEAVTILGIVAVLVWRSSRSLIVRAAVAVAISVFVALVAVARVAINAHYPSDVLAGFLAGIGVLAIFILLTRAPAEDHPPPSR